MTTTVKHMLYCWVAGNFDVLVPKKRGKGFLKSPTYHHYDAELERISTKVGCDVFGLDGALSFQCTGSIYHGGDRLRAEFVKKCIPLLEAHYGVMAVEVHESEYWSNHPSLQKSNEKQKG